MQLILTLAELEASACTGLTRFLALYLAGIAGEETGGLERGTPSLSVYLAKCTGDTEPDSLSLSFDTATYNGDFNIELAGCTGNLERLVHDITEGLEGKILIERPVVNGDVAFSGGEINTGNSCLASSKGVCLFHLLFLDFV